MKKLYGDPEINISYFNGERICVAEGDPVLTSGIAHSNYQDANNWVRRHLEENGTAVANIISFTF